jgi:signal peptidase I
VFGLFSSVEKKMRTSAGHWLEMAGRVYDYRRDQLSAAELGELTQKTEGLRRQLREGDNASKLKLGIEALEDVLRRTGGAIYPKSSLVENVEFFLVAAIVILGIRTYFVQPFKIPTNSMWPSYNGMTGEVFKSTAEEPGYVAQGFRFLAQLATPQRIDAPAEGEVMIMFDSYRRGAAFRDVPGRKWLVLPTLLREYQLVIGGTNVPVRVPADFDLDRVLLNAYFDGAESYPASRSPNGGRVGLLRTGKFVQSGERALAFDILTGDQLFVDRFSYHFFPPRVGQGFVFRTGQLTELHGMMPGSSTDQYYIKRLVGEPGDELEIRDFTLLRNGAPITGSEAFAKSALRADRYAGYRNEGRMQPGSVMNVPARSYAAFGDNSASSLDSRYWGFIPDKDVVGKPLFIYYPFTTRWGPAP